MALAFVSEGPLWFTRLVNAALAGPANRLLEALGIHPHDPRLPIPDYIALQILVAAIIVVLFLLLRSGLSVDRPSHVQQACELAVDFMKEQAHEIGGHHAIHFVPMVLTLGMFILFSNLLGLIPTMGAPTANIEVTVGCAMLAFLYYHYQGARHLGVGKYIAHFGGPIWWLAPLMFPIEIVSHLGRPLSLSVRLFANIFAGHLIGQIFFGLVPLGVPMIFLGLDTFVSFLQAYIFMLLTLVYLGGAVAEEH
jgi:F-type H+-transporting ATPase subunit a